MLMSDDSFSRVLFRVVGVEGDVDVETLWAVRIEADRYRLDNSPFFAYGVSWQDVIHAPIDRDEGLPTFERVIEKSGNRTVRVILAESTTNAALIEELAQLQCTYEGMNGTLLSVTIPPHVDLNRVLDLLVTTGVEWEHADPTWEQVHGSESD